MKLDCNIYGEDLTGAADAVASRALEGRKLDDMGDLDQSDQSRSAKDTIRVAETATVRKSHSSNASDSRAVSKGGHATTSRVTKSERE